MCSKRPVLRKQIDKWELFAVIVLNTLLGKTQRVEFLHLFKNSARMLVVSPEYVRT